MDKGHMEKEQGRKPSINEPESVEEIVEEVKEESKEEPNDKNICTITITLDSYQHIVPQLPTADIQTIIKFSDKIVGESTYIPITDDPHLLVNESFHFKVDITSKKEMDSLISNPALLTVYQCMGTYDASLCEQLQKCEKLRAASTSKSFESIVSIYEAFTGDTFDRNIVSSGKKKGKGKKGDKKKEKKVKEKHSKSSKTSKTSGKKKKGRKSEEKTVETVESEKKLVQVYGMCTLDFLPLFYGKSEFTETLGISPTEVYRDEHMIRYKICPELNVTVSVDKALCFPHLVVLNVTVESIFNIPSLMRPDMECKICTTLPMGNSPSEPIIFSNPSYRTKSEKNQKKCWPGIRKLGGDTNTTKYKMSEDKIKNMTEMTDIESLMEATYPRIRFNTLKRNMLLDEGISTFRDQIRKYRNILFEFIIYKSKSPLKTSEILLEKGSINQSTTSIRGSKTRMEPWRKSQNFLHLMSIVDISSLLYPGVTKIRVACPLSTFCYHEALQATGATNSYFMPKPPDPPTPVAPPRASLEGESHKVDKKSDKSKKKDKSSEKNSKYSKGGHSGKKGGEEKQDYKNLLPPKPETPPEPEPSTPIYSENGKQTFIIIEIELSEPIIKKREIEDLNHELQELLEEKIQSFPKIVLTHRVTKDYYREMLTEITKDIYDKYKQYVLVKKRSTVAEKDFIKYLESVGAYQTYLTSLREAIALLTTTKFRMDKSDMKNSVEYQNFIGEVFVYLVSEMNDTINRLICSGLQPVRAKASPSDKLYLYAKEAAVLGRREVADRYFLERICYDDENSPNGWFDYAIFNLEIKQQDKAYECVLEALSKRPNHRYSLLLLGIMLAGKGQRDEAETCFLNILVIEPRWIEGWVTLYLFYKKFEKFEGMDMALEMVEKYVDEERVTSDYFMQTEDLLWVSAVCPKTIFFRTATLLLKMRLYDWVEMALVQEVQQYFGYTHYLLSAVCMYQELYEQALEHILLSKTYCGPSYAICSLSGHCHFALTRHAEALNEYSHVVDYTDRPDDIHLVYVNAAQILDNFGMHQEARKMILLACKYCPTHYTWFRAGEIYLQENDLLSAEECFSEANYKDNRCAEYWGYLALINLKLNRVNEAELCYSQAIKHNLDEKMHESIRLEFKKLDSVDG